VVEENIILQYSGELTQQIISNNVDKVENGIKNMGMMGKVVTILIELSQNMMTYSKTSNLACRDIAPFGSISVIQTSQDIYTISSKNIISIEDKQKVEPKLVEIKALDANGIKKKYKELRRSGKNMHDNNGGIGFYEIAKQTSNLNFEFKHINDEKYFFYFNLVVEPRTKK
jgi:hypothetical protein